VQAAIDFVRRPYDKWLAYGQAETANILFAIALDARGREHNVRAFSVHPGSIAGPLARHPSQEIDMFGAVNEEVQRSSIPPEIN
jgi:NAD(P)-dependent dehydrogenase (short-subunit alcohol dehydrogenase family)